MSETQPINGIEVLSRLIDGVQRSVDRGNADTNARLDKIDTSITRLEGADKTLTDKVTSLTDKFVTLHQEVVDIRGRVERLEGDRDKTRRDLDSVGHETTQAINGVKAHIAKVDGRLGRIEENDADQNKKLDEQTQLLEQIKGAAGTLINIARSPRIAAYVAIGAIIGGAIMAIAEKVMQ